jgi:hypothetical protein
MCVELKICFVFHHVWQLENARLHKSSYTGFLLAGFIVFNMREQGDFLVVCMVAVRAFIEDSLTNPMPAQNSLIRDLWLWSW